ncbi:alpha/beta fold hydrolase [Serinicoccus hydrothermalis]|uniref:alpha/beta fold hydrolase n=1 Tax=Serinicoccus hydrothermalis TaxID=1758689 RepID=UPI00168B2C0E|nr:alpha/beta hydrolase [Serinicoccus hydrothermalis]
MAWSRVPVGEVDLEVDVLGTGEPVLWIQTALLADELVPCARIVTATGRYASVLQHRRGYAGSDAATSPGSVGRDALDALGVLDACARPRAHVVGLSYAAAVALRLGADHPDRVATLTLIEPPPVHVPAGPDFRAANADLLERSLADGPAAALEHFLTLVSGPGWAAAYEHLLPGAVAQARRDARTFFEVDVPALLTWRMDDAAVARVTAPVLSVSGTASGPWFAQVRDWVRGILPHADEHLVQGAGHDLALTHAADVAGAVTTFLDAHPIGGGEAP